MKRRIYSVLRDGPWPRFTRVNQKFCEIAGYTAEELLSKSYLELTHPQDRPRGMHELARVLRDKADYLEISRVLHRKEAYR